MQGFYPTLFRHENNISPKTIMSGPKENFYAYKARKEAFVSNLKGTTRYEVVLVGMVFPAVFYLYRTLARYGFFPRDNLYHAFLKEFILLVFVPILCTTVFLDYTLHFIVSAIALSIVLQTCLNTNTQKVHEERLESLKRIRLPFISIFRCGVMLYTCIAILAVDFPAFPRRLAKTETFGTSLMDLGVGMFVFSGGLVSRVARDCANGISGTTMNVYDEVKSTLVSVIPMFLLGFARFATTKGVEYQEHTSEYGVHWNFFFTLAFLSLFSGGLRPAIRYFNVALGAGPIASSGILFFIGLTITMGHQYALSIYRYEEIVLGVNRSNIFLQNKEGICSLVGFCALYFIAASIGSILMRQVLNNLEIVSRWVIRTSIIIIICGAFWTVSSLGYNGYWPIDSRSATPSRRMANTAYVVWVVGHASGMLMGLLLVDILQPAIPNRIDSVIANLVNKHQLKVFLLSNLCTGVVNVSIKTLDVQNDIAVLILTSYMITVTFVGYMYTLRREQLSKFVGRNNDN